MKTVLAWVRSVPADLAFGLGEDRWPYFVPFGLLLLGLGLLVFSPKYVAEPPMFGLEMPSEDSIPAAVAVKTIDPTDARFKFRYAPTGTELRAGIPYWIFRIMPRIFVEEFQGRGYERFGFDPDDGDYYSSSPVPRGLTVSDSILHIPMFDVGLKLKRVSITCSGCHRGIYLDGSGKPVLVDGMGNHTADFQSFKKFFGRAFLDERFTSQRVLLEIDAVLKEDGKPKLTQQERYVYELLTGVLRQQTASGKGGWMYRRTPNGPGRIDAFNAVKFEVLDVTDDGTNGTVDLPSVWNQHRELRSWHHADGNTADSSARNFGSVIGVGGVSMSVNKEDIGVIGAWLDNLPPPKWPFGAIDETARTRGQKLFENQCAVCHGLYDPTTRKVTEVGGEKSKYMKVVEVGTDDDRSRAFSPAAAAVLSEFGERRGLWPPKAFRGAPEGGGYLCGPLDGLWARAPYLHNGSVPTLAELLKPAAERVAGFYRGNPSYDAAELGWKYRDASETHGSRTRLLFRYETRTSTAPDARAIPGNSNAGHLFTVADDAKRHDLLEYLKSL